MANVKVFAERQIDRQAKNYMPLIFQYGGIIILSNVVFSKNQTPVFTSKFKNLA
jgi:hypothetical protein